MYLSLRIRSNVFPHVKCLSTSLRARRSLECRADVPRREGIGDRNFSEIFSLLGRGGTVAGARQRIPRALPRKRENCTRGPG